VKAAGQIRDMFHASGALQVYHYRRTDPRRSVIGIKNYSSQRNRFAPLLGRLIEVIFQTACIRPPYVRTHLQTTDGN
jgi:hypothetical protein